MQSFLSAHSPSPTDASAELLGRQVAEDFKQHNVNSEIVRVVDHDIKPVVKTDMGGNRRPGQTPLIR